MQLQPISGPTAAGGSVAVVTPDGLQVGGHIALRCLHSKVDPGAACAACWLSRYRLRHLLLLT